MVTGLYATLTAKLRLRSSEAELFESVTRFATVSGNFNLGCVIITRPVKV